MKDKEESDNFSAAAVLILSKRQKKAEEIIKEIRKHIHYL
jgi:hypothetical protein